MKKKDECNIGFNVLVIEPRKSDAKGWKEKLEKLGYCCTVVAGQYRESTTEYFVNHKGQHLWIDTNNFQVALVGMFLKKKHSNMRPTIELAKWLNQNGIKCIGIFHHREYSEDPAFERVIKHRKDLKSALESVLEDFQR